MKSNRQDRAQAARRLSESGERDLSAEQTARLSRLGIHPSGMAGRLRLVLTIGCYKDFRFTRDILSTGSKGEEIEMAIQALMDLGASCDCQVLHALGQPARGLLWHHPTSPDLV